MFPILFRNANFINFVMQFHNVISHSHTWFVFLQTCFDRVGSWKWHAKSHTGRFVSIKTLQSKTKKNILIQKKCKVNTCIDDDWNSIFAFLADCVPFLPSSVDTVQSQRRQMPPVSVKHASVFGYALHQVFLWFLRMFRTEHWNKRKSVFRQWICPQYSRRPSVPVFKRMDGHDVKKQIARQSIRVVIRFRLFGIVSVDDVFHRFSNGFVARESVISCHDRHFAIFTCVDGHSMFVDFSGHHQKMNFFHEMFRQCFKRKTKRKFHRFQMMLQRDVGADVIVVMWIVWIQMWRQGVFQNIGFPNEIQHVLSVMCAFRWICRNVVFGLPICQHFVASLPHLCRIFFRNERQPDKVWSSVDVCVHFETVVLACTLWNHIDSSTAK